MSRAVRYVFTCGHHRDWSDGYPYENPSVVFLPDQCPTCHGEAERRRREMSTLWGRRPRTAGNRRQGGK